MRRNTAKRLVENCRNTIRLKQLIAEYQLQALAAANYNASASDNNKYIENERHFGHCFLIGQRQSRADRDLFAPLRWGMPAGLGRYCRPIRATNEKKTTSRISRCDIKMSYFRYISTYIGIHQFFIGV